MPLAQSIKSSAFFNPTSTSENRLFLGEFSRVGLLRKLGVRRIDEHEVERTRRARDSRDIQTQKLAARLRAGGIEVERKDVGSVVALGVISDHSISVTDRWRNVNFLPSMQLSHGAAHRAQLGAYLSQHPKGQYCQYFVLTNGERCEISQIPKRFAEMTRALSRFVNRARVEWPWVEFVARQNEVTINEDRRAHPHINLAVIFLKRVKQTELIDFTQALRAALGGWVKNNRRIKSIDEFVKYSIKFGISIDETGNEQANSSRRAAVLDSLQPDLFDHADKKGDYLVSLYRATFKARAFAAFSCFAEWRRDLRERRLVPKRIGDNYALVRMCPYRPKRKSEGEGAAIKNAENVLLNWAMPHSHGEAGKLVEPTIRILNYNPKPKTANGYDRLAIIRDLQNHLKQACVAAEAARAPRKPDDKIINLADARAERAQPYRGARSAQLYGSHKHRNCPNSNTFTPIGLRDEVLHIESGSILSETQAIELGYIPPLHEYSPLFILTRPEPVISSAEFNQLSFLIA